MNENGEKIIYPKKLDFELGPPQSNELNGLS